MARTRQAIRNVCSVRLFLYHVAGLQLTVLTGSNIENNGSAFIKSFEAVHLDLREMNEKIFAILLGDEAVALVGVEPFNCTFSHANSSFFFRTTEDQHRRTPRAPLLKKMSNS